MGRGQLRVYLGAAPGVGKTFAMLDEGQRRAGRGTDVVVGYVETHNRPLTAARLADLEVLPRRQLTSPNQQAPPLIVNVARSAGQWARRRGEGRDPPVAELARAHAHAGVRRA